MKPTALHLRDDASKWLWLRERHDRLSLAFLVAGEIAAVCLALLSLGLWAVVANSMAVISLVILINRAPPPAKLSRDLRAEARRMFMDYARHSSDTSQWLGTLIEYSPLLFDVEIAWRAGELLNVPMDERYHRIEVAVDHSRVGITNEHGKRVYQPGMSGEIVWQSDFVRKDSSRHLYVIVVGDNNILRVFPSVSIINLYDRFGKQVSEMRGELEDWASRSDMAMTRYLFRVNASIADVLRS